MNQIIHGDALTELKKLKDESCRCCVTSPPYWGLRDYGCENQIGIELSPEDYIERLVEVFRELRRVLANDGTFWLNISDSYAGSGKNRNGDGSLNSSEFCNKQGTNKGAISCASKAYKSDLIKPKDMIGIPWMLAIALRNDGWYLRQDIIWSKTNPMPESVTDRCTRSHEYLFLLSKSPHYYYNAMAISEPVSESTVSRLRQNVDIQNGSAYPSKKNGNVKAMHGRFSSMKNNDALSPHDKSASIYNQRECRNKRSVWTLSTSHLSLAHFATFPEALVEPCILAGSCEMDTVIDPFCGSGTVGVVANRHFRKFIGIELNKEYCCMAKERIDKEYQLPFYSGGNP